MSSKFNFYIILSCLLLHLHLTLAFILPIDHDCEHNDNETFMLKDKCLWLPKFQRHLGKYRNFYANLLQEDNERFAVELQELFKTICTVMNEPDINRRKDLIFYSIWMVEATKNLEEFLIEKGIRNIGK